MLLLRPSFFSLLVTASTVAPSLAQDVMSWETDLGRARQIAAQTNRLVLVHVWGTWCQPCMRMEHEVFSKPGLGTALSPYYVPCKVQYDQGLNEELVKQLGVEGFPCDIVMTPQGQIVHRSTGFQSAEQYVAKLQQAAQAALTQARPVAAGAPASPPPAAAPSPAAATSSDDRYSYYYQNRGAAPTPVVPSAPASPTPIAPVVPTTPGVTLPLTTPVATPVTAPPVTAPPVAAAPPVGDRYADYRNTAPTIPAAVPPTPAVAAVIPPPSVAMPPAPTPPTQSSMAKPEQTIVANTTPAVATKSPENAVSQPPPGAGFQLPPGCPPLALDGCCPVTVIDTMTWKKGNVRYGAVHLGRTYLFVSEEAQKKFLADPDHFSPVISGNDPVIAMETGEVVAGKREFGLMCEKRMFLFSSKASYDKFCGDSKRYAGEVFQALQAGDVKRR